MVQKYDEEMKEPIRNVLLPGIYVSKREGGISYSYRSEVLA